MHVSGPSTLIKDHLAGGASRLAALLSAQTFPIFSRLAPCHPGAALRDLVLVQRGRTTRRFASAVLVAAAVALLCGPIAIAQRQARRPAAGPAASPKTPWGDPDLQGVWNFSS